MSTTPTLHLSPDAGVRVSLTHDNFIHTLNPFVEAVAAGSLTAPLPEAALRAAEALPDLARHFDLPRSARDFSFGLREGLLFPAEESVASFAFEHRRQRCRLTLTVDDPALVPGVGALLLAAGEGSLRAGDDRFAETLPGLLEALEESGLLAAGRGPQPAALPDGITRLQHAGLAVKDGPDLLLVDPNFNSWLQAGVDDLPLGDLPGQVTAIAVSHSHSDHFHLPTLMLFPRDTPIVVPAAEPASLLCPDLAALLRQAGFRKVLTPRWDAPPLRFGNLALSIYPFYGEQPLAAQPWRDLRLRNWGNTYHVQTRGLSCFILIDSGNDPWGRMAEVAERVRAERGPVDVLLSNVRQFHVGRGEGLPFYITGGGHYWFCLTPEQMAGFPGLADQCITLGPEGVAEVARGCQARHVLPYAHWWQRPGEPLAEEPEQLAVIGRALGRQGADMIGWSVGDSYAPGAGGRLIHHRYRES
jgi:L-ascorbate metabolism protein UlaG (beta-lactamase superfamily)